MKFSIENKYEVYRFKEEEGRSTRIWKHEGKNRETLYIIFFLLLFGVR